MKNKAIYGLLMGLVMGLTTTVQATQPLMLSGRLLNNTTSLPIEEAGVEFNVRIKIDGCTVYSEVQNQDLSASSGYFKLVSGTGTVVWGSLASVFDNGTATCMENSSTPSVNPSTVRKVQISVKRASESSFTTFSEENLNSVAFAKIAESLDGKKKEDFIQVAGSVTQSIMSQVATYFSSYSTQLLDLVNGTSASYVKPADLTSALATKQNSLGYVPLNPANDLSDVGSVSTARTNLGLGLLATLSSVGDSQISSVSWSKITSVPSFAATSHTHAISDITNLQSSLDAKLAASKLSLNCTAAQTVQYVSATDSYQCQSIAIASTAVSGLGSLATASSVSDAQITDLDGSKLTGGVKIGTVSGTTCSTAGLTRYNSGALEFCDGSAWSTVSSFGSATLPIISNWISYTPTVSSFGTVSAVDFKYRRVGDTIEVVGTFTSGTPTATTAAVSLPTGLSIDTNKVLGSKRTQIGTAIRASGSTTSIPSTSFGPYPIIEETGSSASNVYFSQQTNTSANTFIIANANAITTSGDDLSVTFKVPISGWSAATSSYVAYVSPPTVQRITSSGTYTTPANVKFLKVTAIGGGGGGAGCSNNGTNNPNTGGTGGSTLFGSLITAAGGTGGSTGSSGLGVSNTITASKIIIDANGASGSAGMTMNAVAGVGAAFTGGSGGNSIFGGAGGSTAITAGIAGKVNSGSGGGGAGCGFASNVYYAAGSGGASGSAAQIIIDNPAASYSVTIGAGGAGGSAQIGSGGGAGGSGIVVVEEFYQ